MNIKERELELFQRWRKARGYERFVRDGVFDEKTWNQQTVRLTFILKDPDWPGGEGDLCENIIRRPGKSHWPTWNNAARWTRALLEGGAFPGCISKEERVEQLKKISFLNLKKVGGGPASDKKSLQDFAGRDAVFIREQLCLYQPDIILCCGKNTTAKIFRENVLQRPDLGAWPVQDWEESDRLSWFYTRLPGRERLTAVIPFVHPQWNGRPLGKRGYPLWEALYEQLLEARAFLLPPP